ncbi:MAG: porin family protein [Bacteroidales bacterium]
MRRFPLLIFMFLISLQAFSQEERPKNLPAFDLKRLHFGFTVGFNSMDLAFKRNYQPETGNFLYADLSKLQPGFQVTIVSDLRLSENWNLRFLPGISFGARDLYFYDYYSSAGVPPTVEDPIYQVALGASFLEFPLLFKYRSRRVNNYRPYLVGGGNFRYDMSAKRRGKYDADTDEYVKFLPGDLYLEFGFGVDTYLKYFKFAPELKVAVGLLNIIDPTGRQGFMEYTESIASARSIIVMLNFHFE